MAYKKIQEDSTRTAGLELKLKLCVGARVMLKRNMDVEAGLVNGSVGTVVGFNMNKSVCTGIVVKFDGIESSITIDRQVCSFEVLNGIYYTRKQFPLMAAFAITIHKSQGLSLQSAIVDVGRSTFGCGMIYVALSRVTSLNGLHLIELDRRKLQCDQKAICEYNRLRRQYTTLGDLLSETTHSTADHHNENEHHLSTPNRKRKKQTISPDRVSTSSTQKKCKASSHRGKAIESLPVEPQINIFEYCEVPSITPSAQRATSSRLNLAFETDELRKTPTAENALSRQLQSAICKQTQQNVKVVIYKIIGDGNCLFRALSLAVTGTQKQHQLMRAYIVDHMSENDIRDELEQLYVSSSKQLKTYDMHIADMASEGVWGTEQEIIAAANLLDVSIVCYSKYNNRQFKLQHFPPHFPTQPNCFNSCHHRTVYLVNSTGTHYNIATVVCCGTAEQ